MDSLFKKLLTGCFSPTHDFSSYGLKLCAEFRETPVFSPRRLYDIGSPAQLTRLQRGECFLLSQMGRRA